MTEITVEEQLREVAVSLLKQTRPVHKPKEGHPSAGFSATKAEIAQTGSQLALMILSYLDGDLTPWTWADDEPPF